MAHSPVTELPSKTLYYPGAPTKVTYEIMSTEYYGYASNTGYGGYNTSVLWNTAGPNDMVRARVKATLGDFDADTKKISVKLELQECRINGDYADTYDPRAKIYFKHDDTKTKYSWPNNVHLSDGAPIRHTNKELQYVPENYFTTLATHTIYLTPDSTGKCSQTIGFWVTGNVPNINIGSESNPITFILEFSCFDYADIMTSVSAPVITIIDLGNNKFRINVTPGADGINNPATGVSELYYSYDSSNINIVYSSGSDISLKFDGVKNSRTVWATAITTGEYNNSEATTNSKAIYQYFQPGQANNLAINCDTTSDRLTLSKDWTLTWDKPTIKNEYTSWRPEYSYYRLQLYKNSEAISQLGAEAGEESGSCKIIQNSENEKTYIDLKLGDYNDLQGETINITISSDTLKSLGFVTGDIVSFSINTVTKWGTLSSANGNFHSWSLGGSTPISSEEYKISGGVVYVKVNDTWTEGQVYVKTSSGWVEAEGVYTKTPDGWAESIQ